MSETATCPTCGAMCKTEKDDYEMIYKAVQDEQALKKIEQLKKLLKKKDLERTK